LKHERSKLRAQRTSTAAQPADPSLPSHGDLLNSRRTPLSIIPAEVRTQESHLALVPPGAILPQAGFDGVTSLSEYISFHVSTFHHLLRVIPRSAEVVPLSEVPKTGPARHSLKWQQGRLIEWFFRAVAL